MGIKIDAKELVDILTMTPPDQNIMIVGRHGIGKSQIATEFYKRKKLKVVSFFLGQMSDPGDLIGLMHKDEKTGHSEFLPPYWWPIDDKPIVLFLDELNRARPEILQSVMDLTLNKTLAGKSLPKGSIVVSAVNEGDEYQLTDLDPALVSRFNVYEFAPTVEDWLIWANEYHIDQRVIHFIQENNQFLDSDIHDKKEGFSFGTKLEKFPDRRAWEKVSNFLKPIKEVKDIHIKIISGIVGTAAAIHFRKSLDSILTISPEQILLSFEKYKDKLKNLKLKEFIFINEQIIYWLNTGNYKKNQKDTILKNCYQYLLYLKNAKLNEGIAHIASMLENEKFQKVTSLLIGESEQILTLLSEYIESIRV
ncbi:MAG: AAA family ATPase [Desulfobacterales bacterium]|nr:AAA family ATPase [Desulfobacterales bacterium]